MSNRQGRRGQAIVLVAIGMAAFLGFLGLVLDGGRVYLEQRSLQRSADLAALSGAWAYYHHNYQEQLQPAPPGPAFPLSVASGMAAAQAAIDNTLAANAYPAGATPAQVTYTDAGGVDLVAPGPADVRGVRVRLSRVLPNQILGALGVGNPTIGGDATAVIGPPSGAQNEAPLLLQNWTGASDKLPRWAGYPACPVAAPDGTRLTETPAIDCRPGTPAAWPQPMNLEPQWGAAPTTLLAPFKGAPVTRFYLLHEPASLAGAGNTVSSAVVTSGLPEFLPTCSLPNPCLDATYKVYADTSLALAADPTRTGMQARVTQAAGAPWSAQSCVDPRNASNPLTPDNPRLVRLPVTYAAAPDLTGTPPNVGGFKISETITFCVATVYVDAGQNYSVSGYLVEEPTADPTLLSRTDPYFGRDVVVRLVN